MKQPELTEAISLGSKNGTGRLAANEIKHDTVMHDISVACYQNEVPSFIEAELARLYGSVFSSVQHFRVYGGIEHVNTYVARKGGKAIAVLLFRAEAHSVKVLNELIELDAPELARFARYIFTEFPSVRTIGFNAVSLKMHRLPFPFQRFRCSEDIALSLPPTPEAYLAQIGKATRKNIKHHLSRVKRHFPSMRFNVYCDDNISAKEVHDIIALNHARMAGKQKVSYLDEEESERLLTLVKAGGMVTVMRIDGRVCGGAICARIGNNYFSYVNAHDPAYDAFRVGTLCCYLTICEAIARGGREFHLLWGRYQYKYMLGGVQRDLDHLDIYRSRAALLLHSGAVLKNALSSHLRQAKFWLLDPERQNHPAFRHAVNGLRQLRRMRTSGS